MNAETSTLIGRDSSASHPYSDFLAPSDRPPSGLDVEQVPQFVSLACDDNPEPDSMRWIIDYLVNRRNPRGTGQATTFDGSPVRLSFFSCGCYLDWKPDLRLLHLRAFEEGHEIGNHSYSHPRNGAEFSVEQWLDEIRACQEAIARAGIPEEAVRGFRTPYLDCTVNVYEAVARVGFTYDASIEEGYQLEIDGTNFLWPYTLDEGSPGNEFLADWRVKRHIGKRAGLWHLSNSFVVVPPDDACGKYEIRPGLRRRVHEAVMRTEGWSWDPHHGKLSGMDHNMWRVAAMTPEEVLATLKYTLDLRLAGNRAPFLFGAHVECDPQTEARKRESVEAFIDYALSKPSVRIVPAHKIIEWMRNPQPLATNASVEHK